MSGPQGHSVAALTAVGAIVLTGCTVTTPTPAPTAVEAAVVDEFSPLVVSMIEPGPIPARGTDGLYHLVYELQVQNASPRPASLVSIVSSADGDVIDETTGEELVARMLPIGDYPFPPRPISEIASGTSALVLMDTTFEDRDSVPKALDQAISATFGEVRADRANFAELFPTDVVALASTPVTQGDPILVGPPLTGPNSQVLARLNIGEVESGPVHRIALGRIDAATDRDHRASVRREAAASVYGDPGRS